MPEVIMGKLVYNQQEYPLKVETNRRRIFLADKEVDIKFFLTVKDNVVWLSDNHRVAFDKLFSLTTDGQNPVVEVPSTREEPTAPVAVSAPPVQYPPAAEDVITVTKVIPLTLAKFFGLATLVMSLVIALPVMVIGIFFLEWDISFLSLLLVLLIPILGFISGFLIALAYNGFQKLIGGISFTTD